uniref:Ribosomal RNA large subunit methyltransferase H n=1 Tax=Lygus hesperus TaxID=30085 RepID=A0A0A9X9J9_LYGHE
MDTRDADMMRHMGEVAKENNTFINVFLPPSIGDPHRLLKSYSLTAYPILDDKGGQLKVDIDGRMMDAFADPDDDYAKVVIPHIELVEFLARSLLEVMNWEATPRGAASLLESLYRGAEIPDHVFQTPAVIEHLGEYKDGNKIEN